MKKVQQDDLVTLSFRGKLDNGEIFKEVDKDSAIQICIGASDIPPSVEAAIIGLSVGDSKKVRVPPEEGYGQRQKDLLQTIENAEFVQKIKPRPGMILSLNVNRDGEEATVPATVMEISGDKVTVDYNHPLAGHHLTYEITILDIQSANS